MKKKQKGFKRKYKKINSISTISTTKYSKSKKMGNLKDLAAMIPGVGKAIRDVDIDDNAFKGIEAIIQSMTPRREQIRKY